MEKLEIGLIGMVTETIEEYLKSTLFGGLSLWIHGEEGKIRAQRLLRILKNEKMIDHSHVIWIILYSIYHSNGNRLKNMVTSKIVSSQLLNDNIYQLHLKKYSGYRSILQQESALKDYSLERIPGMYFEICVKTICYIDQSNDFYDEIISGLFI